MEPIVRESFQLGTLIQLILYDKQELPLINECMEQIGAYEALWSKFWTGSEIWRINHRRAEEQEWELSEETADLIKLSLQYSQLSDGAFDITTEPLSKLWNVSGGKPILPSPKEIENARAAVGYRNLEMHGNRLRFLSPETKIDLGGIAKGYIADRLKDFLKKYGVRHGIINLGGNVLCIGSRPNGDAFRIGIQRPFGNYCDRQLRLAIRDMSVVTSGVYERNFTLDGKNYHHLMDPTSGRPFETDLTSVTILTKKSVDGDGLSTVCFALGARRGVELLNSLPDACGIFIHSNGLVICSTGAEQYIIPEETGKGESDGAL